jgi:hypothetical protein
MANWLRCLRTCERPNANIQFGHQHAVATNMAATALEMGRRQKYDLSGHGDIDCLRVAEVLKRSSHFFVASELLLVAG